jgi:hypothetical protein
MIRKFLSILAIAAMSCSNNEVKGQICTPDANLKAPGFLPLVLPDAQKDVPYSQAITVLAFKDTSVKQGNLTLKVYIDSMKITGITGLPNGMSYNCLNARCVFTPAALSCVKLSGTPNESGIFPLKIAILAYAKVSGVLPTTQKDTIESFVLNVSGSASSISLSMKRIKACKTSLHSIRSSKSAIFCVIHKKDSQQFTTTMEARHNGSRRNS